MRSIAKADDLLWTLWKVEIDHNDGTTVDISDLVYSISITGGIDKDGESISMGIRNHRDWVEDNLSLDPLDPNSTLNQDGSGNYDPLLGCRHEVRVYIRKDAGDSWALRWQGFATSVPGVVRQVSYDDTISFQPFNITHLYKSDQRLSRWVYEDRTLNSMLPSILLDSGFKGDRGHVVIEDDPAKGIESYTTEEVMCWNAMKDAVESTGYIFAARYQTAGTAFNDGSGLSTTEEGYFLTLYDPIRVAGTTTWSDSAAYAVGDRVYYSGIVYHCIVANSDKQPPNSTYWEVGISDATSLVSSQRPIDKTFTQDFSYRRINYDVSDVRSFVQLVFEDRNNGGARRTVEVESDATRLKFGIPAGDGTKLHIKMRIAELRGSCIDTEAEALDYGYAALHDLSDPSPDCEIRLTYFFPDVECHDWYRFVEDDYTVDVGITGYTLKADVNNPIGSTVLKGTVDKVIGRRDSLLGKDMTEEERQRRSLGFFRGSPEQLAQPTGLTLRQTTIYDDEGEAVPIIVASWDRCEAWWYDHTEVWVSHGTETLFGSDPYSITTKTHATITGGVKGKRTYVYVVHVPWRPIGPEGHTT